VRDLAPKMLKEEVKVVRPRKPRVPKVVM